MRVLIVEDERLLAESLKTLLERKGFTVCDAPFDAGRGEQHPEGNHPDLCVGLRL